MPAQPDGPLASSSLASECSSDAAAVLRDECSDGSSASQPGFAPTSAPQLSCHMWLPTCTFQPASGPACATSHDSLIQPCSGC